MANALDNPVDELGLIYLTEHGNGGTRGQQASVDEIEVAPAMMRAGGSEIFGNPSLCEHGCSELAAMVYRAMEKERRKASQDVGPPCGHRENLEVPNEWGCELLISKEDSKRALENLMMANPAVFGPQR